jgi:hypothetical protein
MLPDSYGTSDREQEQLGNPAPLLDCLERKYLKQGPKIVSSSMKEIETVSIVQSRSTNVIEPGRYRSIENIQ